MNSESTTEEMPAPSVILFDPEGDLRLRVGAKAFLDSSSPCEYRVCSAALRRTSTVWKSMLFGPWTETKPAQGDWIVELPEDKPWPTEILLAIIHGSFETVPRNPSLSGLHDILVVADKYDLIHVIRPWVDSWLVVITNPKPMINPSYFYPQTKQLELSGRDHIMRTHAAWEVGCESVVVEEIIHFIFNLQVSSAENSFFYKGQQLVFGVYAGPPDLTGKFIVLGHPRAYPASLH